MDLEQSYLNEKSFLDILQKKLKDFSNNQASNLSIISYGNFTLTYNKYIAEFTPYKTSIKYIDNDNTSMNKCDEFLTINNNVITIQPLFKVFPRKLLGNFVSKKNTINTLYNTFDNARNCGHTNEYNDEKNEMFIKKLIKKLIDNKMYFEISFEWTIFKPKLEEHQVYTILDEPLESCPITFEPADKTALTVKCNHKFSEKGLKGWLLVKKCCPLCRTNLD